MKPASRVSTYEPQSWAPSCHTGHSRSSAPPSTTAQGPQEEEGGRLTWPHSPIVEANSSGRHQSVRPDLQVQHGFLLQPIRFRKRWDVEDLVEMLMISEECIEPGEIWIFGRLEVVGTELFRAQDPHPGRERNS